MVKLAKDINKKLVESEKAEFQNGYALSLLLCDNQFSIFTSIETFFFLSEPEKCLKEIYRVLMPRGRLVLEMGFNKDDGVDQSKLIKK